MAGPPPTLRRATLADAKLLHAMLQELAAAIGQPDGIRGTAADLERHGFGPDPRFFALIASVEGEDAGMLLGFPEYSSWRGAPGIYVQDLYVRSHARGLGIAHALLAEAARMDAAYLRLSVTASNHTAAEFYVRTGFTEGTQERMFTCEGAALARLRESV